MTLSADILALSPLAYWKLDEVSGNFADSSGNGVTLTKSGTPVYSRASLLKNGDGAGTSVLFDGISDYGTSANNSDIIKATFNVFSTTEEFDTAAFFCRYASGGDRVRVLRETTSPDSLIFFSSATKYTFTHAKAADKYLSDGNPHTLITTWDGTDLICYIDDIEVGRVASGVNPYTGSGGAFRLGVNITSGSPNSYFEGYLDDCAIFGTHLTVSDVHTLNVGTFKAIAISTTETSAITQWNVSVDNLLGEDVTVREFSAATFTAIGNYDLANCTVSPKIDGVWVSDIAIPLDYLVVAVDPTATPHLWKCTTAGTTHATTEPTWNLSGTTTDGTVTWTYVDELVQPVTHGPLIPS